VNRYGMVRKGAADVRPELVEKEGACSVMHKL
jgi:hypothetical protein